MVYPVEPIELQGILQALFQATDRFRKLFFIPFHECPGIGDGLLLIRLQPDMLELLGETLFVPTLTS